MADLTIPQALEYFKGKENAFIAPVEASSTATVAHAAGKYFWKGGKLYKATANIAVGGTITVGTNCMLAIIGDDLAQAMSGGGGEVTVLTPQDTTLTLQPCPVTYKWGEVAALTLTVTATTQYHFMFSCPSASVTVLTLNGITGTTGDDIEAGNTYEVDVWAGVALIKAVEITAVT